MQLINRALINHALIDDAFLHLSTPLPEVFGEYENGYLQGLKDFRRHLKDSLNAGGVQPH